MQSPESLANKIRIAPSATAVVALIGRANVGKSTLFNYLSKNHLSKNHPSLVLDYEGVTRDRIYASVDYPLTSPQGMVQQVQFILIDTPGLCTNTTLADLAQQQTQQAMAEADLLLVVLDLRAGLLTTDLQLIQTIRAQNKPFLLLINKADGIRGDNTARHDHLADFYQLGQPLYCTSATQGQGIADVLQQISIQLPAALVIPASNPVSTVDQADQATTVAMIGRPNVGKSSLINRLLGEDRMLTCDHPGTTRDSIRIPWNKDFVLLDTAGVRRRKQVKAVIEKLSVVKTLQAIKDAHIVLLLLDATEGVVDQDLHLLSFAVDSGRGLLIAVNKWDLLSQKEQKQCKDNLQRRLPFAAYAQWLYLSARTGKNCCQILPALRSIAKSLTAQWTTGFLTECLNRFVMQHQLPLVKGKRIKLRYAHQGGTQPPAIVIHGNQTEQVPAAYKRYLINCFQQQLAITGTPIKLVLQSGANPYAHKINQLTPRQIAKKRRLMRFVKRKK